MEAFLDAGTNLLVTFEKAEYILKFHTDAAPRGFHYAQHEGWWHLAIISRDESWFRDPAIYRYFDSLIDDGFFTDFDNVVFHGAHGGGYAAALQRRGARSWRYARRQHWTLVLPAGIRGIWNNGAMIFLIALAMHPT